jgi:hypothetical protein
MPNESRLIDAGIDVVTKPLGHALAGDHPGVTQT